MNRTGREKVRGDAGSPKVVLVTGAARGMGRLHAGNFGREGSIVVLTDIDVAGLKEAADELAARGCEAHPYRLDVSDRAACLELAERPPLSPAGRIHRR
jgi:NAD(P)-dependent dehydrogenase (short-subunit alcohol dehydrogenase family)